VKSRFSLSITPAGVRTALNFAGAMILLLGLTSAALVWHSQSGVDLASDEERSADPSRALAIRDSRKQTRQVEIYYGKTGVLMERWSEDLETLTHGKGLAKTIFVTASIAAVACFLVATRLPTRRRPNDRLKDKLSSL
jgi:hypothetical protein